MQCKHLAYESTIYKDTLAITVCSLVWKARRQHCSVTTITHIPPLPLFPHRPRCSGVPHATEHPGSLTCTACCSHAWAAKISMGTQFSGYPPWPLLWLLCLQVKETVTLNKKKTKLFLIFFWKATPNPIPLKLEKAEWNENWERNDGKVVG